MPRQLNLDAVLSRYNLKRSDLAAVLGLTESAVGYWATGKRPVPAEKAVMLERLLQVPRSSLRPDLWPPPKPVPKQKKSAPQAGPATPLASPPSERRRRTRSSGHQPEAG